MARYSLFFLKVPLNTKQTKQTGPISYSCGTMYPVVLKVPLVPPHLLSAQRFFIFIYLFFFYFGSCGRL